MGCLPGEPDLEGRPCPCLDGAYLCIDDVCILATDIDASATDASSDSGHDASFADTGRDARVTDAMEDATSIDAGRDAAPDAGPTDAGNDVPDVPVGTFCERHGGGAELCLDFETDYAAEGWREVLQAGGSLALDAERSVSGRSLRVSTGAAASANLVQTTPNVLNGTVWHRVRVYVETTPPIRFLSLMAATESGAGQRPYTHIALNTDVLFALHRGPIAMETGIGTLAFPRGEWFCIEGSFDVGETSDSVTYLNGVETTRVTLDTTGEYNRFSIGSLGSNPNQDAIDIWFDDYIVSTTRVPCEVE